jgi:hypothetical protein
MEFKNREQLLADLVHQLDNFENQKLASIRVRFYKGPEMLKEFLGLKPALDALANNLYWDEEGDWSDADRVKADTY